MIWAAVSKSGKTAIRHDDPALTESKAELRNKAIWSLDREPAEGETVSFDTGEIQFDAALAAPSLIAEIKSVAEQRIIGIAPLWRQINDLANPDEQGASKRREQIDAIRKWSNDMEGMVRLAESAWQIADIRSALEQQLK